MLNLDLLRRSSLMSTTLRAASSNGYAFSTNYHACIAMPTWCRCALPILFWPWPPFNLFPSSFITWIFFSDPQWVYHFACSAFSANYHVYVAMLTCYIYMYFLFCFDFNINLTCPKAMGFNLDFLHRSSLIGTTLRALPIKSCVIIPNYPSCNVGHKYAMNTTFYGGC